MKVSVLKNTWQTIRSGTKFPLGNLSLVRILPTSVIDVATLAFIGFLTIYFVRPLEEPDFYWHIIVGQDIINHWDFGAATLQTWGTFDPNWVTTQSLSEVLMYLTWLQFGKGGIALLKLSLWLYMIYWFLKTIRLSTQNSSKLVTTGKWLAMSMGLFITFGFIQERPASISIFLTTLVAQDLVKQLGNKPVTLRRRTFLIFFLWPWFHPGWVLPFFLASLIVYSKYFVRNYSKSDHRNPSKTLFLIPIVPILTPVGTEYYRSLLTISDRGRRWISEWQPIWDLPVTSILLWLLALYLLITLFLLWRQSCLTHKDRILTFLIIGILIVATIFAIRNAIYLIIFLTAFLGQADRNSNEVKIGIHFRLSQSLIPRTIRIISLVPLLFFAGTLAYSAKLSLDSGLEKHSSDLERIVIRASGDLESEVRIINSPNYGGHIHYFMQSRGIPLIDGRVDRYSNELQQSIDTILNKEVGWKRIYLEDFSQACAVLVEKDNEIRTTLPQLDFRLKFREGNFFWYEKIC